MNYDNNLVMDELVDIIDEKGAKLYQASKKEAHEQGLLHACVLSQIRNLRGDFIFAKNAPHKQDPDAFIPPSGGHVVSGEKIDDAFKRELNEETGLQPSDFSYILKGTFILNRFIIGHQENHFFYFFEVNLIKQKVLVLNDEMVNATLISVTKIQKLLDQDKKNFGPQAIIVFEKFYSNLFRL